MTNVTLDFRRYFMPVKPITLAGRVVHLGRYGSGGEDPRLYPLYLGYPGLIRGYDIGSFDASDCPATANGACPSFDRLVGSRLLVFNGEVRAPLVGLFTGSMNYKGVPVDVLAFADSGVAWTQSQGPVFRFNNVANSTDRSFVTSVGFGARVNLMGFLIVELSMAKPVSRPEQGWMFVFNLMPGF
jgi:outer membrane protein assembly factor BamA